MGKEKGKWLYYNNSGQIDSIHTYSEGLLDGNTEYNVYGKLIINSIKEVEENWEKIKKKEKQYKNVLENIPKSLPPVTKSMRIQKKVRAVGFDWDNREQVMEKFEEEIIEMKNEIRKVNNIEKIKDEIGDVFFSLINYSRFIGIDPEEALEKTNTKFIKRFKYLENTVKKEGKDLMKMNLSEMNKYWNKSKTETV